MGTSRVVLAGAITASLLALAGCNSGAPTPSFEELCQEQGGIVMADTTTKFMSGVITGSGISSSGTMVTGSGFVTSPVTFTMKLCIKNGDVIDMEVD